MTSFETVRVLVVGLGSIGRRHARLLSEFAAVELWLCDTQPRFIGETAEGLARSPARRFDTYLAALDRRPDVVFLCTPTSTHAALALEALQAGCDLFVEKPLCTDLGSARQVINAANSAGRLLQVGYMLRFEEGLMHIKSLLATNAIGQIVGARAMIGTYVTLLNARDNERERVPWSLLLDYTHEVDFLHWLFGDVSKVSATAAQIGRLDRLPQPNIFQATLTMDSGALVQLHLDYIQHPQRRTLEIYGDRGVIVYDFTSGMLSRIPHGQDGCAHTTEFGPITDRIDGIYRRQTEHLLLARRNHTRPLVGGQQALNTLHMVDAVISSIEGGRTVGVTYD